MTDVFWENKRTFHCEAQLSDAIREVRLIDSGPTRPIVSPQSQKAPSNRFRYSLRRPIDKEEEIKTLIHQVYLRYPPLEIECNCPNKPCLLQWDLASDANVPQTDGMRLRNKADDVLTSKEHRDSRYAIRWT